MKKKILFVLALTVLLITGCSSEPKSLTKELSADNYGISFSLTVPAHEEKDSDGNTSVVPDFQLSKPGRYDNFGVSNDKVELGFNITSYSYNTYLDYKEKYGDKETSFANYLEFLNDPDFDSLKADQKNFELVKMFGVDAIKYKFSNRMIYVLNLEGEKASKQRCTLTVYTLDNNVSVESVLEDSTIKTILDSVKISGK